MFRFHPELRIMLVLLFPMLCLSQLVYSVSSAKSIDTETLLPLGNSLQAQSTGSNTVTTIKVSISAPKYVLVEKTSEIKLLVTDTGTSHREIIIKVESTLRHIEAVYPTQDLVLRIPPKVIHTKHPC